MVSVLLDSVSKTYPEGLALDAMTLRIEEGELIVLLGPSGSGKTTVLRLLAGLERVTSGNVLFDGAPVDDLSPSERNVAMVFQDNVLYPRFDVRRNIGFPLEVQHVPSAEVSTRVDAEARVLAIELILKRMPDQLSAGQQQLVQAAKAFVRVPDLFLMDEPFGRLDPAARKLMRTEMRLLQQGYDVTTVYATHDQDDALVLADRIAVMQEGRIRQVGTPLDVYDHPENTFVAQFIGTPAMSLLRGRRTSDGVGVGGITLPQSRSDIPDGILVGVRADGWRLSDNGIDGVVDRVEILGSRSFAEVVTGAGNAMIRFDTNTPVTGDRLRMTPNRYHLFDLGTGRAIFHSV